MGIRRPALTTLAPITVGGYRLVHLQSIDGSVGRRRS
jgi:hypothetical protein